MSTHALEARAGFSTRLPAAARKQLPWILGGLLGGFLVPFVLADQLKTSNDLYYGIYGALVIGFLALWARATGLSWRAAIRRRPRLTILLAVGSAFVLAFIVLGQEATNRPGGTA